MFPIYELDIKWIGPIQGNIIFTMMFVIMCAIHFYDVYQMTLQKLITPLLIGAVLFLFIFGLVLTTITDKTNSLLWSAVGIASLVRPFSKGNLLKVFLLSIVYCGIGYLGTFAFLIIYFIASLWDLYSFSKTNKQTNEV